MDEKYETNDTDLADEKVGKISKNVRVEAPSGQLSLSAIIVDLAKAHNEIEQYKVGAYSLYAALNDRLEEEMQENPNSDRVEVIRHTRDTAFGVYLRVTRGDEELHGNRDGEYSGYFE